MSAIQFRLQKQGFELVAVRDGSLALENLEKQLPDVLVADLKTPEMTGLELLKYTRRVLKSKLPIILIGEFDDEDLLMEGIREGANDFILKPFKPAELVIRIRRVLQTAKIPVAGV